MNPRIARRLEDGPDRHILGFYGRPRAWSFGGDGLEDVEPSGAPGRPGGGAEAEQRCEEEKDDQVGEGDNDVGDPLLLERVGQGYSEAGADHDADERTKNGRVGALGGDNCLNWRPGHAAAAWGPHRG